PLPTGASGSAWRRSSVSSAPTTLAPSPWPRVWARGWTASSTSWARSRCSTGIRCLPRSIHRACRRRTASPKAGESRGRRSAPHCGFTLFEEIRAIDLLRKQRHVCSRHALRLEVRTPTVHDARDLCAHGTRLGERECEGAVLGQRVVDARVRPVAPDSDLLIPQGLAAGKNVECR